MWGEESPWVSCVPSHLVGRGTGRQSSFSRQGCIQSEQSWNRQEQKASLLALQSGKYKYSAFSRMKAGKASLLSTMKDAVPTLGFPLLCDSQWDLGFEEPGQVLIWLHLHLSVFSL